VCAWGGGVCEHVCVCVCVCVYVSLTDHVEEDSTADARHQHVLADGHGLVGVVAAVGRCLVTRGGALSAL
jgi:hypothetical protein